MLTNSSTVSTSVAVPKHPRDMTPEQLEAAIQENMKVITSHFDERFTRSLVAEVLEFLRIYFRPVYVGFEAMPERRNEEVPMIFAMNHSGMSFPWDAIMFGCGLLEKFDFDPRNVFRALAAPMLSASTLMNPFLLENMWKRVGAIDATSLNFETMMNQHEYDVLIYPEGVPGIGKGFNRKYQLQTFSTSMIRMALKYKTDIVGMFCINGEYINPYSYSWKWFDRQWEKLGIPFMPIGFLTFAMIFQPWIYYAALPAKLTYVRGKRYKPCDMTDIPWDEITLEEITRIRDEIQAGMQQELDEAVRQYGQSPFNLKELLPLLLKNWRQLPYTIPVGWPALFTEYDRRYAKEGELPTRITRGWFKFWQIVFKNPIVIAYFIPIFGWIPIAVRGMRGRRKVKPWGGSKA
ncbi:MAG: 1-acyl-sn-glycerol-3-phosphate acyltransferase [Bacteroidota bacterium]